MCLPDAYLLGMLQYALYNAVRKGLIVGLIVKL